MPIIFPAFFLVLAIAIGYFFYLAWKHQNRLPKNRFAQAVVGCLILVEAVLAFSLIKELH
jgi:hypothetical protein